MGVALFSIGVILTISGIIIGTSTAVTGSLALGVFEAREIAGISAGIGLPATFLGVVTVLPQAGHRVRFAAGVGAAIALLAVLVFRSVYPSQWYGMSVDYTLPVTAIYFVGAITTLWALFSAVANFKIRNDPGGTVRLRITTQGKTKVVDVSNENLRSHLSGIGFFGSPPDGSVETQTANRSSPSRVRPSTASTDGGATTDDAVFLDTAEPEPRGDIYCGNCSQFKYVRTSSGLQPYCGLHSETMDDMDPCQQWEKNINSGIDRVE
jgi:hypothetical protein